MTEPLSHAVSVKVAGVAYNMTLKVKGALTGVATPRITLVDDSGQLTISGPAKLFPLAESLSPGDTVMVVLGMNRVEIIASPSSPVDLIGGPNARN